MVRFLIIFLLIVGVNYLMGSFRRRIFHRPTEESAPGAGPGDELVQDPTCLTYLSRRNALSVRTGGAIHYFCSPECADAFEKKRS